jgi:hypothetical protein
MFLSASPLISLVSYSVREVLVSKENRRFPELPVWFTFKMTCYIKLSKKDMPEVSTLSIFTLFVSLTTLSMFQFIH